MKETELYRPKIFSDTSKRIDLPVLLFYNSFFSTSTLESRRIESFIQWVENEEKIEWDKEYSSNEIANYFEELSKDKERMKTIRDYLKKNNPTPTLNSKIPTI